MRRSFCAVTLHMVWSTWDRLPLIKPEMEEDLYRVMVRSAHDLRCPVLAVGGVADHVHVVAELHPTVTVAELVKTIKGVSSHFVNQVIRPDVPFKWQGAYGALSVSSSARDAVCDYVRRQKIRHMTGKINVGLEPPEHGLSVAAGG